MTSVLWTAASLANLRQIRAYLEQHNPDAAMTVAASLVRAGESLEALPLRGRPVEGDEVVTRELVAGYGYIIRYRVLPERTVILRVRHGAQRPTTA